MLLIYLIVNYLHRKYGVPLHNFVENWTRGISHLNIRPLSSCLSYFNTLATFRKKCVFPIAIQFIFELDVESISIFYYTFWRRFTDEDRKKWSIFLIDTSFKMVYLSKQKCHL